jgi:hypothetical protein
MRAAIVLAGVVAALPVAANDDPPWRFGIACDGGLPMVIQIEATRAGTIEITLVELMQFCADQRPEKTQWQGGA